MRHIAKYVQKSKKLLIMEAEPYIFLVYGLDTTVCMEWKVTNQISWLRWI
jgi:hypothetical protein